MIEKFQQWLEGQDDFNPVGVPHYSGSERSIRGPNFSSITQADAIADRKYQSRRNQERFSVGQKFRFLEPAGVYFKNYGNRVCTITSVGAENIGFMIDGASKKATISTRSYKFLLEKGNGIQVENNI